MTKRKDPTKPPRVRTVYKWKEWLDGEVHVLRRTVDIHPTRRMTDIVKTIWNQGKTEDVDCWVDIVWTPEYLVLQRTDMDYEDGLTAKKAGRIPAIRTWEAFPFDDWSKSGKKLKQGKDYREPTELLVQQAAAWWADPVGGDRTGTVKMGFGETYFKLIWDDPEAELEAEFDAELAAARARQK